MAEVVEFLSAVLLVSKDAARLATFYRDVLGLPLREQQRDTVTYWEGNLGELPIAIHPIDSFGEDQRIGVGAVRLGFAVRDIDQVAAVLEGQGLELLFAPRDLGWGKMTAIHDPDGNYVELTELGADWFRHLEKRPADESPRPPQKLQRLE